MLSVRSPYTMSTVAIGAGSEIIVAHCGDRSDCDRDAYTAPTVTRVRERTGAIMWFCVQPSQGYRLALAGDIQQGGTLFPSRPLAENVCAHENPTLSAQERLSIMLVVFSHVNDCGQHRQRGPAFVFRSNRSTLNLMATTSANYLTHLLPLSQLLAKAPWARGQVEPPARAVRRT